MEPRFAIYRDEQVVAEADDITAVLAQAKDAGDLSTTCAVTDREKQVIMFVTGWAPVGQEFTLIIPPDDWETP